MRGRTCGMTRPGQVSDNEFEARLISRIAEGRVLPLCALQAILRVSLRHGVPNDE